MPEIGDGVILSYSNAQCYHYNHAIRKIYFPQNKTITAGDLLLINNNNYHTYGVELFNGDFAKVISVSPDLTVQSAPVYFDENGKKVKKNIEISFRKMVIVLKLLPVLPEISRRKVITSHCFSTVRRRFSKKVVKSVLRLIVEEFFKARLVKRNQ
jgi:hypothetical protein